MLIKQLKPSTTKYASICIGAFFCLFFSLGLSGCDKQKSTPDWSEETPTQKTEPASTSAPPLQNPPTFSPNGDEVRFLAYNLRNYLSMRRYEHGHTSTKSKPESEIAQLIKIIQTAHPDILGVCEIGQDSDLKNLQSRLKKVGVDLPYRHRTHGADSVRSLGLLSRFPITPNGAPKNTHYTLSGRPFQISRGILDVTVQLPGKNVRFLGAHLKSKRPMDGVDQALMRRKESILLRKHIDLTLQATPSPLLLVYGDFNDTKHSKAVYTIRGSSHSRNQMEMLNLSDSRGETWTHEWKREDVYSRFDYVFTSKNLTPFIDKTKSRILDPPNAYQASDHRPLLIVIR